MNASSVEPSNVRVVATTLTNLHVDPSFHTELATQVTNGIELEVLKTEGEWCRVRQADGYEGWAYAAYLAEVPKAPVPTHFVSDPTLLLYVAGDERSAIATRLPIGTIVSAKPTTVGGDWAWVTLVGGAVPSGFARLSGLRAIPKSPLPEAQAREQIVADARRLVGTYYVWGGTTAWGIDCSGLSQLCHKLAGYTLLRDARLQFPVGRPVETPFKPGDLLFFHGETNKDRITHVGISTGGWHMIHSSRGRNGVYEEDLESEACKKSRERFIGARSFIE